MLRNKEYNFDGIWWNVVTWQLIKKIVFIQKNVFWKFHQKKRKTGSSSLYQVVKFFLGFMRSKIFARVRWFLFLGFGISETAEIGLLRQSLVRQSLVRQSLVRQSLVRQSLVRPNIEKRHSSCEDSNYLTTFSPISESSSPW